VSHIFISTDHFRPGNFPDLRSILIYYKSDTYIFKFATSFQKRFYFFRKTR